LKARLLLLLMVGVVVAPNSCYSADQYRGADDPVGKSGQDLRVGVFASICAIRKSGVLPTIRLSIPPVHGPVIVKRGKLGTAFLAAELAAEVPAPWRSFTSRNRLCGWRCHKSWSLPYRRKDSNAEDHRDGYSQYGQRKKI
jgi:hypothetical protein